jgi:hypothetical protein
VIKSSDEKIKQMDNRLSGDSESLFQTESQIRKLNVVIEKLKAEIEYHKNLLEDEKSTTRTYLAKLSENEKLLEYNF